MSGSRLPGASPAERVVLHVDMDCFYAACERRKEPSLVGKPVVVGMGYEPGTSHGAVATASYEARAHGVESAQPISQALERLPWVENVPEGHEGPVGHYRPVDMAYYKEVAAEVKAVLHDVAPVVREVSIDEAYLDVTDLVSWAGVELFARSLKERIAEAAGVPASVGAAPTMSAAKLASDHDKPDGLVVVRPDDLRAFLDPIPIDEVHGVGPVTARELRGMGIETTGDLARADRSALSSRFGERGRVLHDRARGIDPRPVEPQGRPKSLSSESAFTEATDDFDAVREKLAALADEVCRRAAERGALYKTIGIKVVTPPFETNTRAYSLSGPVQDAALVAEVVADLAGEFEGETVRKLGVRVSNLSFTEDEQASLAGWSGEAGDEGTERPPRRRSRRGQTSFGDFS